MINRNSYRSLLESVNESTSRGIIKEGPDWESHAVRGSLKPKAAQRARANSSADVTMAAKSTAASVKPEATTVSEGPTWDDNPLESIKTKGNPMRARAIGSSPIAASKGSPSTKPEAAVMSEEFDFVDAILLEGLELYGEENLAIILEHFEQTGELSEELADLISNTLEEATTKQNAKASADAASMG